MIESLHKLGVGERLRDEGGRREAVQLFKESSEMTHQRPSLPSSRGPTDELIQSRLRDGKQGCLDVFDGLVCTHWGGRHEVATGNLSGLHEPIGEAIGLALDRGIEHLDRVRIVLVREHGAFRVQDEAGRFHLLANGCRLDPMQ